MHEAIAEGLRNLLSGATVATATLQEPIRAKRKNASPKRTC